MSKIFRREFIRATTLATAAASLPSLLHPQTGGAGAATDSAPRGEIIDLHTHWFSPGAVDFLSKRTRKPRFFLNEKGETFLDRPNPIPGAASFALGDQWFDLELRARHLAEQRIGHQLISWPTTLGVDPTLSVEEARTLWTLYNNELSTAVGHYRKLYSGVATLATIDPEWSAKELARAHDQLGLIGGVLPVNVFATLEGAKRFAPVFEVAQRYKSHLYLHTGYGHESVPGQPTLAQHVDTATIRNSLDNVWNFAAATITLAYTGFLEAYPDVTVQVAQLGGSGGIALVEELAREAAGRTQIPTARKFRQIYFDTGAGGRGPEAIALATRVLGPEQIVFGTDYAPKPSVAPLIEAIEASPLTAAQRQAILRDNARRLLSRHPVL